MLNWNESYNWKYEEYKNVLNKAIKEKKEYVSLDVEHSDYKNEQDLLRWVKEDGHEGILRSETIVIKIKY